MTARTRTRADKDTRVVTAAAYVARQSEAAFQDTVMQHAELRGWLCEHTRDSRGERAGEPDLRCWRGDEYLLIELKTETGALSPAQRAWHIAAHNRGVIVYTVRPSSWDTLEALLA